VLTLPVAETAADSSACRFERADDRAFSAVVTVGSAVPERVEKTVDNRAVAFATIPDRVLVTAAISCVGLMPAPVIALQLVETVMSSELSKLPTSPSKVVITLPSAPPTTPPTKGILLRVDSKVPMGPPSTHNNTPTICPMRAPTMATKLGTGSVPRVTPNAAAAETAVVALLSRTKNIEKMFFP